MVDYFQNSIADPAVATPGSIVERALAEIESSLAVEPSDGIGLGLVVSRGTNPEKQVVLGGDASPDVLGISARMSDAAGALGSEATNLVIWPYKSSIPILRKGKIWVACTGTGVAGSRLVAYDDITGAIVLGTAGAGETQLDPRKVELLNTVSSGETLCLLRINYLDTDTVTTDDHIRAECLALAAQTDEAEVSGTLNGVSTKQFAPEGIIVKVASATGTVAADATLNVGISSDGAEIMSAVALTGLNVAGETRFVPMAAATLSIAGNATIYANIESADSTATTLVLNVYVVGRQF
jgi:hypothetical protein